MPKDIYLLNTKIPQDISEMNEMGKTKNLQISENKPSNYFSIKDSEKVIPPRNTDVFINNGRRNHLQYLSLQDTPYTTTLPFNLDTGEIESELKNKIIHNSKLFNPNNDGTKENYYSNKKIAEYAKNNVYENVSGVDSDRNQICNEMWYKRRTYTADGVLYYQKPYLYFRKLVKIGKTGREEIQDGIIQTDTYINNANQTLYSMLSEQPKSLIFYNVYELIKDISNNELRPREEDLPEVVSNKVNINTMNFNNIHDTNISDSIPQYLLKYNKDTVNESNENILDSTIIKIQEIQKKSYIKIDISEYPTLRLNNNNHNSGVYNDISQNQLLNNVGAGQIIFYWSFDNIYPRNKEKFVDSSGSITKLFQPFDYRNKISYLKNIRTSNLLPRVENINIYIRKHREKNFYGLIKDESINKSTIKYHWVKIMSLPQINRESYLNSIKISKNKIYRHYDIILQKEKELFDKFIGNDSINEDAAKNNRVTLGNFLIDNDTIYYYLDVSNNDSTFFIEQEDGNYIDSSFNFLPYYFKNYINKKNEDDKKSILSTRNTIKEAWKNYMNDNNNFLKVIGDIIESEFDIKIVLVNNAVVDLMEKIMLDGHRLELIDNDYNTLMFYKMNFDSGYEPTLPIFSITSGRQDDNTLYINFDITINFIEDDSSYDLSSDKGNEISNNSDKILQFIEYVFIEKENYRLKNNNLDLAGEVIRQEHIKLYDFDGNEISMGEKDIQIDNDNLKTFYWEWLESYNDTYNYVNDLNSIDSHSNVMQDYRGTYYRITFEFKKTLGFMDISGLDYQITLWGTNSPKFDEDNDDFVKNGLIKNPDNFYIIRDISNVINDVSFNDFYDISFGDFKTNLNEDISDNFNFDQNFYKDADDNFIIDDDISDILSKGSYDDNFFDTFDNTFNNKLVKNNETKIIEAIKVGIMNTIIENKNLDDSITNEIENFLLSDKDTFIISGVYNGGDKENIEDIISKLKTKLKNEFNKEENIAKKMYDACKYKKFKYYIFKIEKYIRRPRRKIKYEIKNGENNKNIDISLSNKVFIDIPSNFNNISNNQQYSEDKFLDSGVLYSDIYARVLNNNKDKDGTNTKPSLFSKHRKDKYIKIWKKISNNKITPYINSKKSILNTLDNNYSEINTDISTNFDISNNIRKEYFDNFEGNSLNPIIYLNRHISSKNKLELYIGNKDKKNIIEISKYTENINISDVVIDGLGKNMSGRLCDISLNYIDGNGDKKYDRLILDSSNEKDENNNLNILDISDVEITNDKLRKFVKFDIKTINVSNLFPHGNIQNINLSINNSYNNTTNNPSNVSFYLDDISQNPTVKDIIIGLKKDKSVAHFYLFGIKYIDYFNLSELDIYINIENLFGKFEQLNREINEKGFLLINLYNSFEIFGQNNKLITDENKYKLKFSIDNTPSIDKNGSYKIDLKKGKFINNYNNDNDNTFGNEIDNLSLKKLRYKNQIEKTDINSDYIFEIADEKYKLQYHSRNNFTYYENNKTLKQDTFDNSQNIILHFNKYIDTFEGDFLYDIMNQKFYNFYMNANSSNNYKYYELSGIKINTNKNIVYDDGEFNDNSPYNAFFDENNLRSGPTSRTYPQKINFNNFKRKWESGKINFIEIKNDYTRRYLDFDNNTTYSLLCQVGDGKLINQDINFNKNSIFYEDPDEKNKLDYKNVKKNYESKLKNNPKPDYVINDNNNEYIQECNIKWIVLNNELYYDLLFDSKNNFKNDNEAFLLHKINSTLGRAMENNGGLILGRNGKPTGFYLCQLFRREPIHKYVIIIKGQTETETGTVYAIIDIGSQAYWTQNTSVNKFYSSNFTSIINGANQSSNIINELFYTQIPGTNYNDEDNQEPTNETHYIFNKCWSTTHYNFIKQTKEPGYNYEEKGFTHYYLFGF